MWLTDQFVEFMQTFGDVIYGVVFHTCMFGAARKKETALWTNIMELCQLSRSCTGDHPHAAWGLTPTGTFATADECAYNSTLCAHWAAAIEQYAIRRGLQPAPATLDNVGPDHLHLKDKVNRAILGALPRGSKMPPLLTDFLREEIVEIQRFPCLAQAKPGARLTDNTVFPKGSRLLHVWNDYGGLQNSGPSDVEEVHAPTHEGETRLLAKVGMPVPPLDYLAMVTKLVHPDLQRVILHENLERAIEFSGPNKAVELRRRRILWTKSMVDLMAKTKTQEEAMVENRPLHLKSVLAGKKFGLMHAALESIAYPDAGVALEANSGFPLVGWMKQSGVFASNLRPPALHVDSFEAMAASFSARTLASIKPSQDSDLDMQVWEASMAEVTGWHLGRPLQCFRPPSRSRGVSPIWLAPGV